MLVVPFPVVVPLAAFGPGLLVAGGLALLAAYLLLRWLLLEL
jgi:hypothetical protein